MEFSLPRGILMGVSTAATQIEGGDVNSNWNDWYKQGKISDGTNPATANDHRKRWREDTELMAGMGIQTYRFSVEWARLVPERGRVCCSAVQHYRRELQLLRQKGIHPLLTIHHFTNPMWFEQLGGFTKKENLSHFLDLVELVANRFGDLVSDYITINEPNVYATNSYFFGQWPPGKKSLRQTLRVMENLAYCHIKAYLLIHWLREQRGYTDTRVGCANHLRVFAPKNPKNPWHRFCSHLAEYLFQNALTKAMTLGDFPFFMKNLGRFPKGEYTDFIGLNYYTRSTVHTISDGVRENSPRNDLNWEIYPQGLEDCARKLYDLLPCPIWVTENGTCDRDDRFRSRYLFEHLQVLSKSDLPFARYYHWCFCDNFEWVEGNSARFGLVSVDPETRERKIKSSGKFYAEIIKAGGVTEAMYERYVAPQVYDIR